MIVGILGFPGSVCSVDLLDEQVETTITFRFSFFFGAYMPTSRLVKLFALLKSSSLEALALNAGPSLIYVTGLHFHLSERPVVVLFTADHEPVFVLPELEMLKVAGLQYKIKAFPYDENPADWRISSERRLHF